MALIDNVGRVPYDDTDTTRNWIETSPGMKVGGKVRPNLVIRYATDTNYVHNVWADGNAFPKLYNHTTIGNTNSIMNLGLPGQRVNNILNWQVTETTDEIVQTASFECLNVMLKTKTSSTIVGLNLPQQLHSEVINTSYVQNSLGTISAVSGDTKVSTVSDPTAPFNFYEDHVKYRYFQDQWFSLASSTGFPDPAIPNDDDNDVPDDANLPHSSTGFGAYYVLVDDEVMRVHNRIGGTYYVRAGGRAINGVLQNHGIGSKVTLLNVGPKNHGEWTGLGYLNLDDYAPQTALLRPGTCLSVYEGYGTFPNLLYHDTNNARNYAFTGYWFVSGIEPSLQEDGTPKVRVDLKSVGNILDQQKITPDLIQRIKGKFGQWAIRNGGDFNTQGQSIFGAAGHTRDIPGDWVDFNQWDPTLKDSYPLAIKIELAQHKEFFQHMQDTQMGLNCEICQNERSEFLKEHPTVSAGDVRVQKSVGKHIYKQSIRVMNGVGGPAGSGEDGPIRTYVRLMATMAAAGWEHPALGTDLAQRFSKMPAALYDNIRNVKTGLVYNGNLDVKLAQNDKIYDWSTPTYDDNLIYGHRGKLLCPFESTYDKSPFSQPMLDLADINSMVFYVSRRGYPCLMPTSWSFRPNGLGYQNLGTSTYANELDKANGYSTIKSWFMTHGSSITGYSNSLATDQILTQIWVTATTAFDSGFTTPASGTGFDRDGRRLLYSPLGGNREGLSMTSGIQQVDTISLDNLVLGLDWDTQASNWGAQQILADGTTQILNPLPAKYDGSPALTVSGSGGSVNNGGGVTRVQKLINFMITRRYIEPVQDPSDAKKYWYSVAEDGKYGKVTEAGVKEIQSFLNSANFDRSLLPSGVTRPLPVSGNWDRTTYKWWNTYINQATDFIKLDVWWYAINGHDWNEYVAAVTGVSIPLKAAKTTGVQPRTSPHAIDTPNYVIDDKGVQRAVLEWQKTFIKSVQNIGNSKVNDSINKATVRSITTGIADPRVQPGDVIWCTIPGYLGMGSSSPYKNGIYVTQVERQFDTQGPSYTATISGYRYRGEFGGAQQVAIASGYAFVHNS